MAASLCGIQNNFNPLGLMLNVTQGKRPFFSHANITYRR